MEWEKKTELVSHLNSSEYREALDIVVDDLDSMDDQSWDMFFHGINLIDDGFEPLIHQHFKIYISSRDLKTESMRTAMRIAAYDQIVERIVIASDEFIVIAKGFYKSISGEVKIGALIKGVHYAPKNDIK